MGIVIDTPSTRTLRVQVTISAEVSVPAELVGEHVPKRLYHWPAELLDAARSGWAEKTGLSPALFDDHDVEIEVETNGHPSTY